MARLMLVLFLTTALAQSPDDSATTTTTPSPDEVPEVSGFQRAASSQMGTGQVLAAGGAAAAHRRREQEGFEEALASTLGSGNSQHAYSAAGDAYFAAGDAYHAAAGGGAAAASHRRREHHGGFLDPHHQAPGVVAGHHTLADILMPGHVGHDFPNRIGYGGNRNDPYIDEIGSAMPFGDPMPHGHADPLSLADTLAHGHPLGGPYPYNTPSDARPYGRPLDPRPFGSPSDAKLYGHGSPLSQRPYGSPVDSRPYVGSIRDLRPFVGRQECPQTCDLKAWPRCQCLSPATYSDDGRGNCNVGAMNNDLQVWCYVDPSIGNPLLVCPDSRPSDSKPGYFWSRFACITESV